MSPLEQRESRGKRRGRVEERLGGREPGWRRGGNEERGQASKAETRRHQGRGVRDCSRYREETWVAQCGGVYVYV